MPVASFPLDRPTLIAECGDSSDQGDLTIGQIVASRYFLDIRVSDRLIESLELTEGRYLVGRASHCQIRLDLPYVSRVHGFIVRHPLGGYVMTDGSPEGKVSTQGMYFWDAILDQWQRRASVVLDQDATVIKLPPDVILQHSVTRGSPAIKTLN
jgi:hypothetical protein